MVAEIELVPVEIPANGVALSGDLTLPATRRGVVLFAHGSGSSHKSPRNQQVARTLNRVGLATLLFDLLTPPESADRGKVFDVPLLAQRLMAATHWTVEQDDVRGAPLGYFGASTGAAAALWAAAQLPGVVGAVVSRGGRPDLASARLREVRAPTLLIVGGRDWDVLEKNRQALKWMRGTSHKLSVIPGATHLFEEPGALEEAARQATDWFSEHLPPPAA